MNLRISAIEYFLPSKVINNQTLVDSFGFDVDFFVFHQASKYMLSELMERIKIPEDKMIFALSSCGNTVSSSIPIALHSLMSDPSNRNKRVLLSSFGVGFSWASVIIRL